MKTLTVDDYQRVRLPGAKPRTKFSYDISSDGTIRLTELKAEVKPDNLRLVRKHGYTVAVGTRKITQQQIRKELDEFP